MKLNVLESEGRFIVGAGRPDSPLKLPPLFFGDQKPVELRVFKKGVNGLYAVDVSSYEVTLLMGPANVRPALGFWQLTTVLGTSRAIAVRASNESVALGLGDAFGTVTVEGGNGSYIVTLDAVGEQELPTATFQGNTLSNVLIFEITSGTDSTPAQYRIEVLEIAPARIVPAGWTAGETTPASTFEQVSGRLWQLVLDHKANTGFFTLTVDGIETGFLSFFSGAYQIAIALATAGKSAAVEPDGTGGFFVLFSQDVTAASVGGNLVILPFLQGSLDLRSTGVRELLDGLQNTPVKLSVILEKEGQIITVANADVMLLMPINQPATIAIDAPEMAGITFATSDDGSYMHVYINGVWLYDIPLNNPPSGPSSGVNAGAEDVFAGDETVMAGAE